jgi:hypothetical protein
VESDDFSSPSLNAAIWTVEDPQGGAVVSMTGNHVSVSIPSGVIHDPWTLGNTTTRLMQSVDDADFEIEVKFQTGLSNSKSYGLLIEETDS